MFLLAATVSNDCRPVMIPWLNALDIGKDEFLLVQHKLLDLFHYAGRKLDMLTTFKLLGWVQTHNSEDNLFYAPYSDELTENCKVQQSSSG